MYTFQDLKAKMHNYTKKSYLALGNLAKLVFWSILSFKNGKINTSLSQFLRYITWFKSQDLTFNGENVGLCLMLLTRFGHLLSWKYQNWPRHSILFLVYWNTTLLNYWVTKGHIFCTEIKILNSGSHDISQKLRQTKCLPFHF